MTRNHAGLLIIAALLVVGARVDAQAARPYSEGPPALVFSCTSTSGPSQTGTAYTDTCTASGGTVPYHFSVSGTLPSGLSSGSTANSISISGRPTAAGTYDYTLTVTDSGALAPQTASQTFSGSVSNPPSFTATPSTLDFGTYQPGNPVPPPKSFLVTSPATDLSIPFATSLGNDCSGFGVSASGGSTPATVSVSVSPSGMTTGSHTCTITLTSPTLQASTTVTALLTITVPAPPLSVSCRPGTGPSTVGAVYTAICTASGGKSPYTWSLGGTVPAGIGLNAAGSSATVSGTVTAAGPYNYAVTASDSSVPAQTASETFTGSVTGPAPPPLSVSCTPGAGPSTAGAAYSAVCTASGGRGPYTWSLGGTVPPGIGLNAAGSSATVSGTVTAAGPYNFTVTVSDSSVPAQTATETFTGTVTAPRTLTLNCPGGGPESVGVAYTLLCTVSGGQGPYRWSVNGTLPPGVSLNSTTASTVTVSGTPTSTGPFSYTLTAVDSSNPPLTASLSFAGTVQPAPVTLTIVCTPLTGPSAVGTAYSATCNVSAGVPPFRWSVTGTLPPGVSLNASSGTVATISGIPTTAGPYRYTVTVTDSSAPLPQTVSLSYEGSVASQSVPITSLTVRCVPAAGPVMAGQAYSATCTASGATRPYVWSIGGTLPAGLSLTVAADTGTATISGTPPVSAAGPYNYVLQVADSTAPTPQIASQTYTGTILAPLTLDCQPAAGPVVAGLMYTISCVAAGGTPAYNLSVTGAVPAGMSVTSTATTVTISGTPSTAGPYSYTVTVTDSGQPTPQTATQSYTGIVSGPAITTSSLPNATVGSAYSVTLGAGGGALPYVWSADQLPQGLALDPNTGVISGTPAAPGAFTISIQLVDQNHALAVITLNLTIGLPAAPAIDFSSLPATVDPAQQLSYTIKLGSAYPLPVTGNIVLKFTPAQGLPNDPSVLFDNGNTTVPFTIDKNAIQATVPVNFQTGSVTGDLVVSVENLTAAGQAIGANPAGSHTTHVNADAPVIKSFTLSRAAGALTATIVGYASSGQVATANFQFTPATGANLQTTQVSVPVQTIFTSWYQSSQASQYGSNFTYTQQFQVQGDPTTIASVTVTLTNQQGTSQPVTAK